MDALRVGLTLPGLLAFLLAVAAAAYLLRTGPRRAVNLRLAPLLVVESGLALYAGIEAFVTIHQPARPQWAADLGEYGITALLLVLPVLYLRFLATIETPMTAWLKERRVDVALLAIAIALAALALGGYFWPAVRPINILVPIGMLGVAIYGIAAAISLYRLTEPGSARRAQAGAYAIAFVSRDLLLVSLFLTQFVIGTMYGASDSDGVIVPAIVMPLTIIVYVPLLAYGALKTQLFDLDLKVKVGIERSTLLTIVAIGVLVTQRVVERYASATFGWIAAVVVAVAMLLLKARLDKVASRVANVAMPQVQPTPAYVQFKKLEVYKTAVETALEDDGKIDDRERAMLSGLARKLHISPEDCAAVEAEVASRG